MSLRVLYLNCNTWQNLAALEADIDLAMESGVKPARFFRALARKYLQGQCLWVSAEEAFYFLPKVMPNNY